MATPARLVPCPSSPNCVSSQADPSDTQHYVAPLPLPAGMSSSEALAALARLIDDTPRARVLESSADGLRAIERTRLFRFIDDIDACVDPVHRLLHIRSASRLGVSDLGVNRRRVEGWLGALAKTWGVRWPQA
jgi:uncharacterized protein (DUF1499 family)